MIERIVELKDFRPGVMREVDSYLPMYFEIPSENITVCGADLNFTPTKEALRHFLVTEFVNGIMYIHNVVVLNGEKVLPISTKMRTKSGVLKKLFTSGIYDLLVLGEEHDVVYYEELPATPHEGVAHCVSMLADIHYRKTSKYPTMFEEIGYELYDLLPYQPGYEGGFIRTPQLFDSMRRVFEAASLINSNGRRTDRVSLVNRIFNGIEQMGISRFPGESDLIIHKPNRFLNLIKGTDIYYFDDIEPVPLTTFVPMNSSPDRLRSQITTEFDVPMMEVLKFCDSYFPENFEAILEGDKCSKFTYSDPLWEPWGKACQFVLHESFGTGIELAKDVPRDFYHILARLNEVLRYKTTLNGRDVPIIKVSKQQDNVLSVTVQKRDGYEYKQRWDITLFDIASPEQYCFTGME